MALSFDKVNRIITVQAPDTEITIQNLLNSIREWEDELTSIDMPIVVSCAGKEPLGGGVVVGLTLTLLDDWQLAFEARSGPSYIQCVVSGGNIVADNVNGSIFPTAFTQVLITASSSATQADLEAIQYASYQNAVWVDVTSTVTGLAYPSGNRENPVNNIQDAVLIGSARGFSTLQLLSDFTLRTGDVISNFHLSGVSHILTNVVIETGCLCANIQISSCSVTGVLDGGTEINNCIVSDLVYFNGHIHDSGMIGLITLDGNKKAVFSDCRTIDQDNPLIIDMGGTGQSVAVPNYSGLLTIRNLTDASQEIGIGLNAGMIVLENTITAGTAIIGGTGLLTHTQTGTEIINSDGLVNVQNITSAASLAYTDRIYIDVVNGTSGTDSPQGTEKYPVDNLNDALIIATREQKSTFNIGGELTILTGQDVSGFTILSARSLGNSVIVNSGAITVGTYFENLTISGTMGGSVRYTTCVMGEIFNFNGGAKNCLLIGDQHLVGTGNNYFTECDVYVTTSDHIEIYQNATSLNLIKVRGRWGIHDKTSTNITAIDLVAGLIVVDVSCNVGEVHISGIGSVQDDSSPGCIVKQGSINNEYIAEAVSEYDLTGYTDHTTYGGVQVRMAYKDIVAIDVLNGSPGTTFPAGMPGHEVDNYADAHTILETYHLSKVQVNDDVVIPAGANLNGVTFVSGATIDRTITIPDTASTRGTKFRDVIITGTLDGKVELDDCQVEDLYNFSGMMSRTAISGTLSLDDSTGRLSTLDDCRTGGDGVIPILHINGAKLSIVEWAGSLNLESKTGSSVLGVSTIAGSFNVKNTCTTGMIIFAGIGTVNIEAGTTSIVNDSNLVNKENIANEVLDSVA